MSASYFNKSRFEFTLLIKFITVLKWYIISSIYLIGVIYVYVIDSWAIIFYILH